jgi:hypothetical protein
MPAHSSPPSLHTRAQPGQPGRIPLPLSRLSCMEAYSHEYATRAPFLPPLAIFPLWLNTTVVPPHSDPATLPRHGSDPAVPDPYPPPSSSSVPDLHSSRRTMPSVRTTSAPRNSLGPSALNYLQAAINSLPALSRPLLKLPSPLSPPSSPIPSPFPHSPPPLFLGAPPPLPTL